MKNDLKISIIIPCYDMYGYGVKYLNNFLSTIEYQTYKNIEIITPDHSVNDKIEQEIKKWNSRWSNKDKLNIIHFYNERGVGNSSINMNDGIKKATGQIIKVMHMDDFFCNENALYTIVKAYKKEPDKKWGIVGFNHIREDVPKIHKIGPHLLSLSLPQNTTIGVFGCPSTSFFIRDQNYFDENLVVLNDKDMHLRLQKKYGDMIIIKDICVTIRMHSNNFMKKVDKEIDQQERNYINTKHDLHD